MMATGPVGNRLDKAGQGPGSGWALGPTCQGSNWHTVVVPLVVQWGAWALLLVAPGRMVQGAQQEWVALGMVLGLLAGLMA